MHRPASWRVQHVETSAGHLFVRRREGVGMPLILWPSIFFDHSLYLGLTEWLPNPMIMLDGPGHGRSHGSPDRLTLDLCAQAQEEVLRELNVPAAVAVGTSWGGLVAITHAMSNSGHRVKGLILANTPFGADPSPRWRTRLIVAMSRFIPGLKIFRQGIAKAFFSPSTALRHPEVLKNFLGQEDTFENPGLHAAIRSVLLERPSLLPALGKLDVPVLVIAGEDDSLYPLETLKQAATAIQGHRLEVIPATGHLSLAERPHECSTRIKKWLAEFFPVTAPAQA
ncbi:pimeloyl-ACP methyl ester carboxylesterase [Fluviicoccus keumensis]|uniref:Pimeloyl-ACP methyl ester carboxylesterase n=2 Tax=Fluviicoccus keumensis TaxID=1435465 RepID=A0A4Q7ZBW9_9GAMM|nr:pimeloyl-ACP methyl ester carboxylesterase [Fluviicoccus keumensis]